MLLFLVCFFYYYFYSLKKTGRPTDNKPTDTKAGRQTTRQVYRQQGRPTDNKAGRQTTRQQADRQKADRQQGKYTDNKVDRQTTRQAGGRWSRHTAIIGLFPQHLRPYRSEPGPVEVRALYADKHVPHSRQKLRLGPHL